MNSGTIKNSHATGNVSSTSGNYTRGGGLVGEIGNTVTIEKCYATGNVTGTGHFGGGLVGVVGAWKDDKDVAHGAQLTLSSSYATGNITLPITQNFAHAGGVLGSVSTAGGKAVINNCYATGAITVRRYSSGFVGSTYPDTSVEITNGYTTSNLSGINLVELCGTVIGKNDGKISCTGFVAWKGSDLLFCYPADAVSTAGNYYGNEDTVSAQAKKLGWSEDIWDLSKDLPTLK